MLIEGLLVSRADRDLLEIEWTLRKGYASRHVYREGKRTTETLHRVVIERKCGFRPDRKTGHVTDHKNRNKLDCRRSNLRVASYHVSNLNRSFVNMPRGEGQWRSRLTTEKVKNLRAEYAAGKVTLQQLATKFGCHFATVSDVVLRKTWKHVL